MIGAAGEMIFRACGANGIELLEDEISEIRTGHYKLLRVDINYSFAMGTRSNLLGWIKKAALVAHIPRRRSKTYGSTTVNWGEQSRHWSIKAYAKGDELIAAGHNANSHKLPADLPNRQELLDWCADKLRIKVSLKARHLKKLGLDQASAWNGATAYKQFRAHLSQLSLDANLTSTPADVEALPSHLRTTHRLWQLGDNLSGHMTRSKLYRHRKELLRRGIDISSPPGTLGKLQEIALSKYLESPVALPDWALTDALYFSPKKPDMGQCVLGGAEGVSVDDANSWENDSSGCGCVSVEQRYSVTDVGADIALPKPQTLDAPRRWPKIMATAKPIATGQTLMQGVA